MRTHTQRTHTQRTLTTALLGAIVAGTAQANEVFVSSDIATSQTWTADNTYNLQDQIYVLPGATLTIEPGTVIASTTNLGGSLAVTKGAKIIACGTQENPIIWTSKADVATWDADPDHPTGGDPKTGDWQELANTWGNLTIMGSAYISENATAGNVPTPNANNVAAMEGLTEDFAGDTKVLYGGGDDDDDSGSLAYCSFRYGGKVIGLNNELNGLSMGGIGRGTDVHHIEIMNNVDDGIETWGGTVNYKYISIWNIGDDSFDFDQGWRGKAQFGLIVQGYSVDADQGSGVGDNMIEGDGAEDSDWQPVSTCVLRNFTLIGQPVDGDGAFAYRDNLRMQVRQSLVVDCGEKVVRFDNVDGDGANGYGFNGTLDWPTTWTTPYTAFSTVNAPANPADFYKAQQDGNLIDIRDSVFFNNQNSAAYTEADARGVFAGGNNNVKEPASSPITVIARGPQVTRGGKAMEPVIFLDPRPQNDGLVQAEPTGPREFWTETNYRGAFAPGLNAWTARWTASDAFGFTAGDTLGDVYCDDTQNANNAADIAIDTTYHAAKSITLSLSNAPQNQFVYLLVGDGSNTVSQPPGAKGDLCVVGGGCLGRYDKDVGQISPQGTFSTDIKNVVSNPCAGAVNIEPGATWQFQYWHRQPMGQPATFSSAISVTFQ